MVVCLVDKHRTVAFVWGTVGTRDSALLPRGAVPDIAGLLTFSGSIKSLGWGGDIAGAKSEFKKGGVTLICPSIPISQQFFDLLCPKEWNFVL